MNFHRTFIIAAALFAGGASAYAQATIDHNKALAGNVTPGDGAGYPITISQPGSYKLTSNLYVPAGISGIVISAPNVTLDLNGFTIAGPVTCSQNTTTRAVTCSAAYSGQVYGIGAAAADLGIAIRNGTVQGFAGYGIFGSGNDLVERVHVTQNSFIGIDQTGTNDANPRIADVLVDLNGVHGMTLNASGGVVSGSRVNANGGDGIYGNGRVLVLDTQVRRNFSVGLRNAQVSRTSSTNNGTNRTSVTSLGGNYDGAVY